MTRRLLNVLTALSLLLCAAVCVLWVRSYGGGESIGQAGNDHNVVVNSVAGRVGYEEWRGERAWQFDLLALDGSTARESGVFADADVPVGPTPDGGGPSSSWRYSRAARPPNVAPSGWPGVLGIGIGREAVTVTGEGLPPWQGTISWFTVPYWAVFAFMSAPAIWKGKRIAVQRLRPRSGHCPACGYNLTSNVSGVCPECGEAR